MILSIDISSNSSLQASSSFAESPLTTVGPNERIGGKKQRFICFFLTKSAICRKNFISLHGFIFLRHWGPNLTNQLECFKVNVFALINGKNLVYCTPSLPPPFLLIIAECCLTDSIEQRDAGRVASRVTTETLISTVILF